MLLEIQCGEDRIPVEIAGTSGQERILLRGREVLCDWVGLPDGHYSIILDGQVFDWAVRVTGDTCSVTGRDGIFSLRIIDPRRSVSRQVVEEGQPGLQRVLAEMPGKVIRLLVKPGDRVSYDQALLVVEAMKMQNEIRSPKGGIVKEIGVKEAQAVNSGDFLLSLE